jgi:hypothetical protein
MVQRIQRHHGVFASAPEECVLIQRRGSRVLTAAETGERLQEWLGPRLAAASIPWRCVVLEELAPLDQWRAMAAARLLIGVHGSGLTNLVFTPEGCDVLEIDFRHHWTCDPLCDAHLRGQLAPGERCSATAPVYRKADYHNLSGLFGRVYQAMPALNLSGYRSANPIDVDSVAVSGEMLLLSIQARFQPPSAMSSVVQLG